MSSINNKPSIEDAIINADKENGDLYKKELEIKKARIDRQFEDLQERKRQQELASQINATTINLDRLKKIAQSNREYLLMARQSQVFLRNDTFKAQIPYFPRNIILVAASTGSGKSTTAANLAYGALCQGQRVLVITNEENPSDVYNRVTALSKGWAYNDHTNFTDEQLDTFDKMIEILGQRMVVIHDGFIEGEMNLTTSVEGIEHVLMSLVRNKDQKQFDVIIIDYYQNINKSLKHPELEGWKAQERFVQFLDSFKNIYNAPIIVLAQKRMGAEDADFKESIEGRKTILNVATCAIEVKADRENLRTSWTVHKSRFNDAVGKTFYTGYKKGMYVPYDKEFQMQMEEFKQKRQVTNTIEKKLFEIKNGRK